MARGNVKVDVSAETRGFQRGIAQAEKSLDHLKHHTGETFKEVHHSIMGGAAALIGAGGLVAGLEESVKAAVAAQAAQVKLGVAVKNAGVSWGKHREEIEKWLEKQSAAKGFMKKDLSDAFSNMIRTTHSVRDAQKLLNEAQDVARTRNMSLATAQQTLARVYNGSFIGLKKLGIAITPVTTAHDALKNSLTKVTDAQKAQAKASDAAATRTQALQKVYEAFHGQAEKFGKTTAGQLQRAHANFEELQVTIGTKLLPYITKAVVALNHFVTQFREGTGAGGKFRDVLRDIGDKIAPIVRFFKDHPKLIAVAAAAWVAYRVAALAALAFTRLKLIGQFMGLAPKAATGGAEAGAAYGSAFAASSSSTMMAGPAAGGWRAIAMGIGRAMGPIGITLAITGVVQALGGKDPLKRVFGTADKLGQDIGGWLGNVLGTDVTRPGGGATTSPLGPAGPGGPVGIPQLSAGPPSGGFFVAQPGRNFSRGSEPEIARRLAALGASIHQRIYGISGYRTPAESVAKGGFANDPHTRGEAADIGVGSALRASAGQLSEALLNKFGLTRPFPGAQEINHIQLLGGGAGSSPAASGGAPAVSGGGGSLPTSVSLGPPEKYVGHKRHGPGGTIETWRPSVKRYMTDEDWTAYKDTHTASGRRKATHRPTPITMLDKLEAGASAAQLTGNLSDDIKNAQAQVRYWEHRYSQAKRSGNARHIKVAADGLRAARDLLKSLHDRRTAATKARQDKATQRAADAASQELEDLQFGVNVAGDTDTTADDMAAQQKIVGYWTRQLAGAQARGDKQGIRAAQVGLRGAALDLSRTEKQADQARIDAEKALTEEIKAMRGELKRQNDFAVSVANITSRQAVKALADVLSGQIVGFGVVPRAATAGSGVPARY